MSVSWFGLLIGESLGREYDCMIVTIVSMTIYGCEESVSERGWCGLTICGQHIYTYI